MQHNFIAIDDVVELLNLERDPKGTHRADNYNVKCPFCDNTAKAFHMNINSSKNLYRCNRCSNDDRNLTALDLYGRVRLGVRFIPGVSGNGKELAKAVREEIYGAVSKNLPLPKKEPVTKVGYVNIYPAEDSMLNKVYSAMIDLDYLKLSDEHNTNLLNRGLDADSIRVNGYATFPSAHTILDKHPKTSNAVAKFSNSLYSEKSKYCKLKYKDDTELVAGMLIANDLLLQGLDLNGIPGFFKLGKTWFLNYEQGMIIPTRNSNKEIVCLQIRKDNVTKDGIRYITLSASDLKNGVNNGISRTHFPLANKFTLSDKSVPAKGRVIITEGPLKADIAVSLYTDAPAMFVAVQGVNNTKEMPAIASELSKLGVTTVYNAFDMDKICNPYVAKASKVITKMFKEKNIDGKSMFWDYEGKVVKYRNNLTSFMNENNIEVIPCDNDIMFVAKNTAQLLAQNPDSYFDFKVAFPWEGEKGIDDYLLSIKQ